MEVAEGYLKVYKNLSGQFMPHLGTSNTEVRYFSASANLLIN